jgi:non-heme chloroperoxidase
MNHMLAFAITAYALAGQNAPSWRDPSPHQVRMVTVASSVTLEVLDWGGTGRPIVFVGCYLSGHVYDDIGPKLTDQFHVYAVTRRGVGNSDQPRTGYDSERRAADVLEVMTALDIRKPILVGNSCGGGILHTLGAEHPDRGGGLMYLDAAEDPTLTSADYEQVPVDMANLPKRVPQPAPPVVFPEAEQRRMSERPIDPAIRKAIVEDHNVRPAYARIRVPVVAVYRITTKEQAMKEYSPQNDKERAAVEQGYARLQAMLKKWQRDLLAGVPNAKIVELPGANLYMFLSNEADVIRELRELGTALKF